MLCDRLTAGIEETWGGMREELEKLSCANISTSVSENSTFARVRRCRGPGWGGRKDNANYIIQ